MFLTMWLFALLVDICEPRIYYQEIHMSEYGGNSERDPIKLKDEEAKNIVIIKSHAKKDACELITNCTLHVMPPANHGLLVTPLRVDIEHSIGTLSIVVDDEYIWEFNETFVRSGNSISSNNTSMVTEKDGYVELEFEMNRIASTWQHANFSILFTTFKPLEINEVCRFPFYFDCGNQRCIREALRCDGQDNCGNGMDETDCGISRAALITLVSVVSICVLFFMAVLFLQSRQGLIRTLLGKNPKIVVKSYD